MVPLIVPGFHSHSSMVGLTWCMLGYVLDGALQSDRRTRGVLAIVRSHPVRGNLEATLAGSLLRLTDRYVDFAGDPEAMEQYSKLAGHGDDGALLATLATGLSAHQPPTS